MYIFILFIILQLTNIFNILAPLMRSHETSINYALHSSFSG